ncbi:hypothetical protein [Mycolicibacterium phlei]|jgi:hypothetical protein|uniref:hypothetical protein n=1 Tax=Mycolicibacterium phlei TaxID=1771 RepID=UPI00025AD27A|nr:hypothetical protein [Mycolicibacterium phlei]EID14693.1 hypothetical protein MPHLEI_10174 [Mycolicibacterium phlei RIVM601174]MBF4191427.1 hypothetical protein [Mycolicibacterium phlei]
MIGQELNMVDTVEDDKSESTAEIAVGTRVRVHPGSDNEASGVVVEDFGEIEHLCVEYNDTHIADPARRWAVTLDSGELVFVDTDQLAAE